MRQHLEEVYSFYLQLEIFWYPDLDCIGDLMMNMGLDVEEVQEKADEFLLYFLRTFQNFPLDEDKNRAVKLHDQVNQLFLSFL